MTSRFANVSEVPLALAVFLASDFYDYDNDPKAISATTLLKPIRQIVLTPRVPPGEGLTNLADLMSSRMGAAIHDGIEKAWLTNYKQAMQSLGLPSKVIDRVAINPDRATMTDDVIPVFLENRLERQAGDWRVTGKFDFVGEGRVQDFKSTSVYAYLNQTNAAKYIQQGSIYRWLDPKLITAGEMDIHYIFTDWRKGMVKTDPGYPPRQFHTQKYPLMGVAETAAFVRDKLNQIEQFMEADESDLPLCSDADLWRSEPVFKYYKTGDVTSKRSTKNFSTRQEALIFMGNNGNAGAIKEVPGEVKACKYCPAFAACSQKDALIRNGDLVMDN